MTKPAWIAGAVMMLAVGYPLASNIDVRIGVQNTYAGLWAKMAGADYVIVGDSISKGGDPWFWRLRANPLSVVNLARSGYTTEQLTPIIEQAAAAKPRVILYMSGTNDVILGNDPATNTLPAYRRNLEVAMASGARVIVTLAPPTSSKERNSALQALNEQVRAIASAKGLSVIDLSPALAGPDGVIDPGMTGDGIHLRRAAYAAWVGELQRLL